MITFQDKVALNDNPDIPNINKIKDSDINALKAGVNANETNITNLNTYSTSETNTGQTWIDGKPIYRRVLEVTTASSDITSWTVFTAISTNVENIIDIYGYALYGVIKTPIPRYENDSYFLIFLAEGNDLKYRCKGFPSLPCKIVVEYTKTTD